MNSYRQTRAMIEPVERRTLMADFRVTGHRLYDEDLLFNPTPSIVLSGTTGDRIYQRVDFATTAVPAAPDVQYHFAMLGRTLVARDSGLSFDASGTAGWSLFWGSWQVATAGTYPATVTLDATNLVAETDETNNSSTISFTAVAAPEIRVYGLNSNKIVDGQVPTSIDEGTDFGFIPAGGSPVDHVFTVNNVGVLPLNTSALAVPAGFSIVEGLSASIAPGASDTFTVRAQTSQPVHGNVTFTTNDLNEGAFNFPIQANLPRPTATSTLLDLSVSPARVLIGFNTNVRAGILSSDFTLINTTTGQTVTNKTLMYDGTTNTASIAFTAQPANGRYRLTASAGSITDAYGNPLTAPISYDFSYVRGDVDGDGLVGFSDLLIVSQNYGQTGRTFAQGNADYSSDGLVAFSDLLIIAQNYGSFAVEQAPRHLTRVALDILE